MIGVSERNVECILKCNVELAHDIKMKILLQ